MKTAIQIDFDGTVTVEDVSFLLLDTFAGANWRKYLAEYTAGNLSLGAFSKKVFVMIKEDEKTLTDFVLNSPRAKTHRGLWELIDYCKKKGIRVLIVSNGLEFYIKAILDKKSITGVEVHAAENVFSPQGMKVRYIGPDDKELEAGFKEAYTDMLCREGYDVIYVGNGTSDIFPSHKARHVFATADLLQLCREEKLKHYHFRDFFDVIKELKKLKLN